MTYNLYSKFRSTTWQTPTQSELRAPRYQVVTKIGTAPLVSRIRLELKAFLRPSTVPPLTSFPSIRRFFSIRSRILQRNYISNAKRWTVQERRRSATIRTRFYSTKWKWYVKRRPISDPWKSLKKSCWVSN